MSKCISTTPCWCNRSMRAANCLSIFSAAKRSSELLMRFLSAGRFAYRILLRLLLERALAPRAAEVEPLPLALGGVTRRRDLDRHPADRVDRARRRAYRDVQFL